MNSWHRISAGMPWSGRRRILPLGAALAISIAGAGSAEVPTERGWQTRAERSPAGESSNIEISLVGTGNIEGWPDKILAPALVARCKDSLTEVYVEIGWSTAGDSTKVTVHLDRDPPETSQWKNSADRKTLFYEKDAIEFLRSLAQHQVMRVEFKTAESYPTQAQFTLTGLDEALAPLQQACLWPPPPPAARAAKPVAAPKPAAAPETAAPQAPSFDEILRSLVGPS